jgi:hypothetical protein
MGRLASPYLRRDARDGPSVKEVSGWLRRFGRWNAKGLNFLEDG